MSYVLCETSFDIGTLAQWCGAAASFSAVGVALFKEPIIRWLKSPKLKVTINTIDDSTMNLTKYGREISDNPWYLRLRVTNEGKSKASNCKIIVSSCHKKNINGEYVKIKDFLAMKLLWTHTAKNYSESIEPGVWCNCEFGKIHSIGILNKVYDGFDLSLIDEKKPGFVLETEVKPYSGSSFFAEGEYRFSVLAVSDETKSKEFNIDLKLKGMKVDDREKMFNECVSISISEK